MHTGSFQVGDFIEDIEEIIFYLKIVHDLYQSVHLAWSALLVQCFPGVIILFAFKGSNGIIQSALV